MEDDEIQTFIRFDSAIEFKTWTDTPEGYLEINATAATVGVMSYRNHDGSPRREFVPPEELEASVRRIKNIPLVDEHPFELPKGFVDSKTIKHYQVGEVVDASFDSKTGRLNVRLIVRDERVVAKVKARKLRGVSPGYEVDREPTQGADYEFIQRNRRYNHLALTKAPRNAESVIHLDSDENAVPHTIPTEKNPMEDDEKNENQPSKGEKPGGEGVNLDSLAGKMDAFVGTATKVLQELRAQTAPEPAPAPEPAAFDSVQAEVAATEARIATLEVAKNLGVEVDRKTESTSDIRRKIVASQLGESFDSDAADGYVDAAFAFLSTQATKKQETKNSFDSFGASFDFPTPSDPSKRSTGFDSDLGDLDFVVDPTALAHGHAPATRNAEEA